MTALSTYLFDLDGTLIDSLGDLATGLNLLRKDFSLAPISEEEVRQRVGDGARKLVQRSLPEELFSEEAVHRFLAHYQDHLLVNTRPYPGIIELLSRLQQQGAQLGVVTNKPIAMTQPILSGLGLDGFFGVTLGGDSVPNKKPAPDMIHQAMTTLGSTAAQTIVVGDHHTDLRSGQAAGTKTCFCQWGFGHNDGLVSDFLAPTSLELRDLLAPTA